MSENITLTIDGRKITVPAGTLIVDAAKMVGIDIPVFCYHPKMEPVGMCRMCLVEVGYPVRDRESGEFVLEEDGSPKIQFAQNLATGCTEEVAEGMVVNTATDPVDRARKDVLEFILTSHPLDCPVCDKGGECPLQNLTMDSGPAESRFLYDEKIKFDKHVPLGDLIFLDRERCIQCARCTRFQSEIVGDPVIGFYNRGRRLEIVTFSEPGFDSYFSGNTTDICPVGALTTADFRFGARPWELNSAASICPHCPVGCNLTLNTRREAKTGGKDVIKRVMPRQNEWVNEIWICDKGRFGYHFTESEERITRPLMRKDGKLKPVSWNTALKRIAQEFEQARDDFVSLGSGRLSNEDLFNLRKLSDHLGGEALLYSEMAGGDLVAQVGVGKGTNFTNLGAGSTILVVASDLEEEAPIWWLRVKQAAERGATLIVTNPRATKLDRYAHHLIRYPYGAESGTVLTILNELSSKRMKLPEYAQGLRRLDELKAAARAIKETENLIVLFGGEGVGYQASQELASACTQLLIATGHVGKANNGLIGVWSQANTQGAWDMGMRPTADIANKLSRSKGLYLVGVDPIDDDPAHADALKAAGFVVVQDLFLTKSAQSADVVLPASSFAEREGTYTSGERRVQRFYPVVKPVGESQADFMITAKIAESLELKLEGTSAALVMSQIAVDVDGYADISYGELAKTEVQIPIVGRSDLYYGGTGYANHQGVGVQVAPTSQRGQTPSLEWRDPPVKLPKPKRGLLWAVPISRLYDNGRLIQRSTLLSSRLTEDWVWMNPADALKIGLSGSGEVEVQVNSFTATVLASVDADVPEGIVLVARSSGIPITEPTGIGVRSLETVKA